MAGGRGTRIAALYPDLPKPLIPLDGIPVLEQELISLREQGLRRVIITVSHLADKIIAYFGDGSGISPATGRPFDLDISYFREEVPLGNAGALLYLRPYLADDFLLLNADSLFELDINRLLAFHHAHHPLATILTHPNSHPYDSGLIITDNQNRVTRWLTKEDLRPEYYHNLVNAGVHVLSVRLIDDYLAAHPELSPCLASKTANTELTPGAPSAPIADNLHSQKPDTVLQDPLKASRQDHASLIFSAAPISITDPDVVAGKRQGCGSGRGKSSPSRKGTGGWPGRGNLSTFRLDLDRDLLRPLAGSGQLISYRSPEYIKDMGTPERLEAVARDVKAGLPQSRSLRHPQKAVFLDRDGTLIRYVPFLNDPAKLELLHDAATAIRQLNNSGYLVILVTNQPVIARGELTFAGLDEIHRKLETLLGREGAYLDAIYFCPHHPDKGFPGEIPELKITCTCRKPSPGLLLKAAQDFNLNLQHCWMVGDATSDIAAGQAASCHTIMVPRDSSLCEELPDCGQERSADDLLSAVEMIQDS